MYKDRRSIEANSVIRPAIEILNNNNNNPNPNLDCRILLGYAMGLDRSVYPHEDINITQKEINIFNNYINEREKGKPVSRIIGKKNFWKMSFQINSETLDPRPDSEVIIKTVLNYFNNKAQKLSILDLGSGSGCLGLSIINEYKNANVFCFDASMKSLEMAKLNALNYKLNERSQFIHMNWSDNDWDKRLYEIAKNKKFDIIIANPPYIPSTQIKSLQIEVKKFEPILALDGGKDGLDSYRFILPKITNILKLSGRFVVEIGIDQEDAVNQIASHNKLILYKSNKDLSNVTRVLMYGLK